MSHNKQNVTSSETTECSMNTDSSDKIKAENEALTQEHEALQKELQGLQETLGNKTELEENCEALKKFNEEMKEKCTEMKKEIQRLKEEHKHTTYLIECYDSEKEILANTQEECGNLQKEIEKLQDNIEEANTLLREKCSNDPMEALMTQSWNLWQERQCLFEQYYYHPNRETLETVRNLKKENEDLEAQISDIRNNVQVRRALEELKAEEKVLQEHSRKISITLAGVSTKFEIEEDWRQKYLVLRHQTDALKHRNEEAAHQIQIINENLEDLAAAKRSYKTLKAEKNYMTSQNRTLERELEGLRSKLRKEQSWVEKNNNLRAEIEALSLTAPALQAEITELRENLQGERVELIYESLKAEKKNISQHNNLMEKERDKLIKQLKKEKALKEKCAPMRAETDDLRRQQEALKRELSDLESRRIFSD
ncbi:synaptonemal complex protein 1-like [Archocentrus centrarchus]|uniref:synaptonemal complex protein 1-like n=1 Tax=Archocentrus centrarchus TaxID=63155 RepID=UPI0011EA373A|nr:synaptonemal complex protein 1-like [Archocentrus centrarchus]